MQRTAAAGSPGAGALHCAVAGPADASYRQRDLEPQALGARMGSSSVPIRLMAHSSGSFVAQHLLRQWQAEGRAALLARVRYVNLYGGLGSGERAIDAPLIAALADVQAVYAHDAAGGESANAGSMRALHALAPERVRLRALAVPGAGCVPQAKWCLHDALITRRPHDPTGFDLERDYGALGTARPVQDDYLRARPQNE